MADKRTKAETIQLFKMYADGFRKEAREAEKDGRDSRYVLGKADAYEIAAFELERNMEG